MTADVIGAKKDRWRKVKSADLVSKSKGIGNTVGRTSQRLQQKIKQHVPKTILQGHISQDQSTLTSSCKLISFKAETSFYAIGQLLQNHTCPREHNNKFSILARGRTSFHLSTLEATYIKPNLCKHKELVYGLKITH